VPQLLLEPKENELPPPEIFDAKLEIIFRTLLLPHFGQITSTAALALRTSSSKAWPHSEH
jgi:hypothetical protein